MTIKPIRSEADYDRALASLEKVFDAPPGTKEGDEAEILSLLIEHYEDEHYPITAPDPIEAIKIRMQDMNIRQADLVGVIGAKSSVSEVLNKRRKLTLEMIRNLTATLKLSAEVLVQDYQLAK
jgi:HTH-type transcriptional regulator/antitoxin HigA